MKRTSGHDVLRAVSTYYRLSIADLESPARYRSIARPRQLAMYIMRQRCPHLTLPAIGRLLGGRDHTTVMHGIGAIAVLLRDDHDLRHALNTIEGRLGVVPMDDADMGRVPFWALCAAYERSLAMGREGIRT
jgi:chromosomal replication initiator protein